MTNATSYDPVPSLRERFVEDMNLHRLSRATQRNYLRDVARFANWLGRPPDQATDEDLRRYQIEQRGTGLGAPAMNTAVSALRFFYTRTLDRQDLTRKLHRVKHPRALPTVLSREEVARLLDATMFGQPSLVEQTMGKDGVAQRKALSRAARKRYEDGGVIDVVPTYEPGNKQAVSASASEYYIDTTRGGGVRSWRKEFALMGREDWLAFDPITQAASVDAPALIIHSDGAAFPDQARKAYGLLAGQKECIGSRASISISTTMRKRFLNQLTALPHISARRSPEHRPRLSDARARPQCENGCCPPSKCSRTAIHIAHKTGEPYRYQTSRKALPEGGSSGEGRR